MRLGLRLQLDLLRGLHRREHHRHLPQQHVGHQLCRLRFVLGQHRVHLVDLLPGLHDRDVDLDLHRHPDLHLLDVQHQLPDVLSGSDGMYLERVDRHLHRHDRAMRIHHQQYLVWISVRLHVDDLGLLGDAHAVLVPHELDDVQR